MDTEKSEILRVRVNAPRKTGCSLKTSLRGTTGFEIAPSPGTWRGRLPTAVLDPAKPLLELGLDVHLEFTMAVAQKDHAHPHAPRKFTRAQPIST